LHDFLKLEAAGGVVLVIAALAALVVANSPLAWLYEAFLNIQGAVIVDELEIRKPLYLWLNDGWMAVFFFLVGLEIKREFMGGELSGRASLLPIVGALGGMALPAAIYAALNWGDATAMRGWAIPTATDIAFALGVLALLGPRAPVSLKVLLTAIAIIDDLGAIVIIATFYTAELSLPSLALAAAAVAVLAALNLSGVRRTAPYVLVGAVLWVCVLKSGIHATLAGVATALAIPITARDGKRETAPLARLEHLLHPWVVYLVLPAFAFANAGVSFKGLGLKVLEESVTMGIAAGLVAGKLAGVFLALRGAIALGVGPMPAGCTWRHILGLAALCGIGFTMSLFIGNLAFSDDFHAAQVRLGVLGGSVLAAGLGYWLLARATARTPDGAERKRGET
jgi:NhaA family Na+:H+ antiporter